MRSARVWFKKNIATVFLLSYSYVFLLFVIQAVILSYHRHTPNRHNFSSNIKYHGFSYVEEVTSEMYKKYFIVYIYSIKHIEINFNCSQTLYEFFPEIFSCGNLLIMFEISEQKI